MKRVAGEWASYRESVMPADASEMQVQECRRAFYGGARALLAGLTGDAWFSPGPEATKADMEQMLELEQELKDFKRDVLAGRA